MSVSNTPGALYIVATPIGNLGDLGARARALLGEVDLIAAEDTRHTRRLLDHIGVHTAMLSLHEHNEAERVPQIIARLLGGARIALVTDAGTPLISDPGFRLVRAARDASLSVLAVPGPCAAVAALSIAGLPSDRFAFEGFLPARAGARRQRIAALAAETRTMVFYVAPRQLRAQLNDMVAQFGGEREGAVAREITKLHESFYRGTLAVLAGLAESDAQLARGEIVLLVAGAEAPAPGDDRCELLLRELLRSGAVPLRTAVAIAARVFAQSRNNVYESALRIKREMDADSAK